MARLEHHLVVALAYDGLCTFEFGCTVELFALSRPEVGPSWYRFAVSAVEPGPIRATGGFRVVVDGDVDLLDEADTIVVPGWRDPDDLPPADVLRRIAAAHERGARLCSICSGVFVLAAAGVLAGKRVTTHWRYAERLAAAYPELEVDARSLYVDAGSVLTSAGSASGLDMLLHLVRRDHGPRIANVVAQRLVMPPHRDGGQAQFVPRPLRADDRGRLGGLMEWVRSNLAAPHTIAALAERASMSRRTLQRQFRETVGCTPLEWILGERIAAAKDLLEATRAPLQRVAEQTGFASQESFRRHFRRVVGTSPAAYRRRFRHEIGA